MSGHSDLPPHLMAFIDQVRAKADDSLTKLIDSYRDHVEHHDGDTMCAFGTNVISAMPMCHSALAELLARAVERIVCLEDAAKTGTPAGGPL